MYLVHQKLQNKPHYLTNAILLSPAGVHTHASLTVVLFFGWFFKHIVNKFISHIAIPDIIVDFIQKIQNDISTLPACRDLITWLASTQLGGKSYGESPIWKSAQLLKSALMFGFSNNICI